MKLLFHSLLLIGSFLLVFIWEETSLISFTVQALGILVFMYLIISFLRKKRNPSANTFGSVSDIFILNTAILLVIVITGNLYSPIFFLLYFLGFGITFIFEPLTVFVFALGSILIFLPEALKNASIESYIRIGSVALISPLAFFFGQEYRDRIQREEKAEIQNERLKETANTIAKDVEEVLQKEKDHVGEKEIEEINEILEETEELREEAKES